MRKVPETNKADSPAERELRRRIDLSNRPRLKVGIERIDEVASALARSSADRVRFTEDPTSYLQAQALPVSSCTLVYASPASTSEVCSVNVACNANAAVNVNVGTKVNVALAINVANLANVINTVYVYNAVRFWGFNMISDEGFYIAADSHVPSMYDNGVL
ncbi:MAG TPA: hypothetical protein VJT82_10360 [Pyrinomonadaceae bacterium]|nr:hypothetical protein [Pyrinomonadaceae bacterium]